MKKQYDIFIDASFIRSSKSDEFNIPLSTEYIKKILKFISKNKIGNDVHIIIPEPVLREIVTQKLEIIKDERKMLSHLNSKYKRLFGIKGIDVLKFNYDYKSFFQKKCDEFIKKTKLKKTKLPEIDVNSIIERAFNKKPPFQGKGKESDKGFKDTIIWYSILDYCKTHKNNVCVLCTSDEIFKSKFLDEELKKINGAGIKILEDPSEVIEFLSLELKIEKQEWGDKIEDIRTRVEKQLIYIMNGVNKSKFKVFSFMGLHKVTSFDFRGVQFIEVNPNLKEDEVVLRLELTAILSPRKTGSSTFVIFQSNLNKEDVEIKVTLSINKTDNTIKIREVHPEHPLIKEYDPFSYLRAN